jgi:hypothetical protein
MISWQEQRRKRHIRRKRQSVQTKRLNGSPNRSAANSNCIVTAALYARISADAPWAAHAINVLALDQDMIPS